ncbi:MAG: alkaline phosphatase family protein [Thermodesulfobacteriota bacterium]|nr:alkaline phosphatase family protein [Thermodesulfobacteriota bacterium]
MGNKVIVIGLDGATFTVLQPWIDQGFLPTFKKMQEEGVSAPLESVMPPITAPAWASFMTGKNPGKHGIFYFFTHSQDKGRDVLVDASERTGKTIWRLLSDKKKKVVVLNVPTTYPPEEVNGAMVSCFLTPPGKRDFVYPPSLLGEIEHKFGEYPLDIKTIVFSPTLNPRCTEHFLKEINRELDYKINVFIYLMEQYDSDFNMLHIKGSDRLQHDLWNFFDKDAPFFNQKMADRFLQKIITYFQNIDKKLKELLDKYQDRADIFIMSDHGFGPVHTWIDLNAWLLEEGFVKLKDTKTARIKLALWKAGLNNAFFFKILLNTVLRYGWRFLEKIHNIDNTGAVRAVSMKNISLSFDDIDWKRTTAYSRMGPGAINVNLKGRETHGLVKPGKEFEKVKEDLISRLKDMRNPKTGEMVNGKVFLPEDIYNGPFVKNAPDIMFYPLETGYLAGNFFGFTTPKIMVDNVISPGNHRMDGVFMACGKNIIPGKTLRRASIMDLASTFLYLLGCPISDKMDGKILKEIIDPDFLSGNIPEYFPEDLTGGKEVKDLSPEIDREVEARLKGLGYLG